MGSQLENPSNYLVISIRRDPVWCPLQSIYVSGRRWLSHQWVSSLSGNLFISNSSTYESGQPVVAIAIQSDQKILLGGRKGFEFLVRLNADGTVDPTFHASLDGSVEAIALLPDRKLLIAGSFQHANGLPRSGIARLSATGSIDQAFVPGVGVRGTGPILLVQSDGKILLSGSFTIGANSPRSGIARLLPNGELDAAYPLLPPYSDPALYVYPNSSTAAALQPDDKLLLGGAFNLTNSVASLIRLRTDGTLDSSFESPKNIARPASLVVQPNGDILLAEASRVMRLVGDHPARFLSIRRNQQENVEVVVACQLSNTYILQVSTNLTTWRSVATNTASECTLRFEDTSPATPSRFYRTVLQRP